MKKIISLLVIVSSVAIVLPTAALASDRQQALNELKALYEKYDESDYNDENRQKLDDAYKLGISNIQAADDDDEAYKALNTAAEEMISVDHRGKSVKLFITVEKTTLGKGFVIMPETVIARKYERASQVLVDFLDEKFSNEKNAYSFSGSIEHNFELTGIKEDYVDIGEEEEYRVPNYIRKYVGEYYEEPFDKFNLKKGYYTPESRFVLTVTNEFPNVSPSAIPVTEEDVLRWQFSVYGNGADLGADTYYSEKPICKKTDKDELITEFARFHAKSDVETLLKDEDNLTLYKKALTVLYTPASAQTAIDRAVDKLLDIKPKEVADSTEKPTPTPTEKPIEQPTEQPTEKPTEQPNKLEFSDVDKEHFAYEAIKSLCEKGIINGTDENTFSPDKTVTRAELSVMLMRANAPEYSEQTSPFSDVSENDWFAKGVSYAYTNGITNGVTQSEFCPYNNISRQDLCVMLARFLKLSQTNHEFEFADDNQIDDYAKNSVYAMKDAGFISGRENDEFCPTDSATRAEAAKILYNCGISK